MEYLFTRFEIFFDKLFPDGINSFIFSTILGLISFSLSYLTIPLIENLNYMALITAISILIHYLIFKLFELRINHFSSLFIVYHLSFTSISPLWAKILKYGV